MRILVVALALASNAFGSYTAEQARRGRAIYRDACAACHGGELTGGYASPLAGPSFIGRWNRAASGNAFLGWSRGTVDDLYFVIRTTMPQGAGGTLSETQYLDVVAFILERNGYEPGDEPLVADEEAMKAMPIEWHGPADVASPEPPPETVAGERATPLDEGYLPWEVLRRATHNANDWLYPSHDPTGRRFSPLDEITKDNVSTLKVACAHQLGERGTFQTAPIVYDGTLYATTVRVTTAIDAATCRPKWRHEWEPRTIEVWQNNRGVAVSAGRVLRGTSDGYLVAIDAADGKLLWARRAADTGVGETFTMAPFIYEDLVILGPAGSENAISGWVGAFRLTDGAPVWRFETVLEWKNPKDIRLGGGAVWTPFTLDAERGELYVAVGNPAPDLPAELRPDDNLYTNSLVALDVRSGELRWYRQLVPNDFHDWDLTQVSPLFRATIEGTERELIATVGKDGLLRVLDRNTHETWYESEVTTRESVDVPLTRDGVRACPGYLGGVLWNGPAYSASENMLYVSSVDWCTTYFLAEEVRFIPGQLYLGGTILMDGRSSGRLSAIDASTGDVRWRYDSPQPLVAAVTTTAGGLVMTGELNGDFVVFDAASGDELYRFYTGGPVGAGIVSYAVDGKQYVAAMSGRPSAVFGARTPSSPTALVFTLP